MWFKKNKWEIVLTVLIMAAFAAALYFAINAPDGNGLSVVKQKISASSAMAREATPADKSQKVEMPERTGTEPSVRSPSSEPGEVGKFTCTITISCHALLDNMELCDPEKAASVPKNGRILGPVRAAFADGESVFDVLLRVCRDNDVHLEFFEPPTYGSVYIEGINNLCEFDAGEFSRWMYKVNGWFPNFGCSLYKLSDNDDIHWVYTCDQGADVGSGINA